MSRMTARRGWLVVLLNVLVGIAWLWYIIPGESSQAQPAADSPARTRLLAQFDTDGLRVPAEQILAGGPPKDGIPALTDPKTTTAKAAPFAANDRVAVVSIGDQTRAYPFNILNWHEAVNDRLADTPFTVIYCPLCDSVSVADRRIQTDGGKTRTLEFGISGLLYNSNVLLYDRQDEALWSQVGLEAISGPHAGKSLKHLPFRIMTFGQFRKQHPDATVLSTDTGHPRNYQRNPYQQYFAHDRLMFPVKQEDDRLPRKEPIVGVRLGDKARAYTLSDIRRAEGGRIEDHIDGQPVKLRADDTGTVEVVQIPEKAQAVHTFWFTWAAFHPDTDLYGDQ